MTSTSPHDGGPPHVAMRRVALTMQGVGALVAFATLPAHLGITGGWWAQLGVGVWCAATALVMLGYPSTRKRFYEVVALLGLVQVGVLVAAITPTGMSPSFLFWPVAALAYFSSRRLLAVGIAAGLAILAVALMVNPSGSWETFVVTAGELAVLAWLLHWMTVRQNRLRTELATAAATDPLTGLLNRREFHPRLERLVAAAAAGGEPVSLLMLDLDHFKRVNDTYGHLAGDAVLEQVAAVLRQAARHGDLVARLGGEEFAVVLTGAGEGEALAFAERVAARLAQTSVGSAGVGEAPAEAADAAAAVPTARPLIAASAGICVVGPGVGSADELLRCADQALYAAKVAGRGRPAVWAPEVRVGAPFAAGADRAKSLVSPQVPVDRPMC